MKICRSVLEDVLEKITEVSDKGKSDIKSFSHIRCEARDGKLLLSGSSRVIKISACIDIDNEGYLGTFGLSAALLKEVVSELKDEMLSITLEKASCWIKTASSSLRLNILEESYLIPVENYSDVRFLEMDYKAFFKAVSSVWHSATSDGSGQIYRTGVNLNSMHVASTDGRRLSFCTHPLSISKSVTFTKESLEKLRKIYKGMNEKGGIAVEENAVRFANNGIFTTVSLLACSYPQYFDLVKNRDGYTPWSVSKKELSAALRRVSLLNKGGHVTFDFSNDVTSLKSSGDNGEASEVMHSSLGKPFQITLNSSYLLDALASFEKDEIEIHLKDSSTPVIIEEGEHTDVIVPIKLG